MKAENEKLSERIALALTKSEREIIRDLATKYGMTESKIVRKLLHYNITNFAVEWQSTIDAIMKLSVEQKNA